MKDNNNLWNISDIKILPREIRKQLNRTKEYRLSTDDESSTLREKLKELIKIRKNSKKQISNPKIKFKNIHDEYNQDFQIP